METVMILLTLIILVLTLRQLRSPTSESPGQGLPWQAPVPESVKVWPATGMKFQS